MSRQRKSAAILVCIGALALAVTQSFASSPPSYARTLGAGHSIPGPAKKSQPQDDETLDPAAIYQASVSDYLDSLLSLAQSYDNYTDAEFDPVAHTLVIHGTGQPSSDVADSYTARAGNPSGHLVSRSIFGH